MKLIVHQNITIHTLRVDAVSNSSVLQIGSAGIIKGMSNLYNTGGFTGPAPQPIRPGEPRQPRVPLVPMQPPN